MQREYLIEHLKRFSEEGRRDSIAIYKQFEGKEVPTVIEAIFILEAEKGMNYNMEDRVKIIEESLQEAR